jgi:hypothetical protein
MIIVAVIIIVTILIIITESDSSLVVRKQNICIYNDAMYIIMRNVKVMILTSATEVHDNSWETNYKQTLEKENKLIQKK